MYMIGRQQGQGLCCSDWVKETPEEEEALGLER